MPFDDGNVVWSGDNIIKTRSASTFAAAAGGGAQLAAFISVAAVCDTKNGFGEISTCLRRCVCVCMCVFVDCC